jgi:hypothetical protein
MYSEENLRHCHFVHHKSGLGFGCTPDCLAKTLASSRLSHRPACLDARMFRYVSLCFLLA